MRSRGYSRWKGSLVCALGSRTISRIPGRKGDRDAECGCHVLRSTRRRSRARDDAAGVNVFGWKGVPGLCLRWYKIRAWKGASRVGGGVRVRWRMARSRDYGIGVGFEDSR